jgi:uncharacterized protein YbbC (DUF1343 family)
MRKVLFGVDVFCESRNPVRNTRMALVTNDAATDAFGVKSRVALLKSGFNIVKLFSPEHGLSAGAADGAWVPNATDALTNLPVVSLYADKLKPSKEDLQDIKTVVFDIPDVGCRFYTYLWTMTHIMEACAEQNKTFIVLDRPNPLGGDLGKAEGPLLANACASFLGRWCIPIRHSCTLGELAKYFGSTYTPTLDLHVVKAQNWNRNEFPDGTNWNFVSTSPAIKDLETAFLYPGLGLLEGINVNEGRGTNRDFKVLGAPWIHAPSLKEQLDKRNIPGIEISTTEYIPKWGLYAGETCFGLQLGISDKHTFCPVSFGIQLIQELILNYPQTCNERLYQTNANPSGAGHLDKLLGIQNSFETLKSGVAIHTNLKPKQWEDVIVPYLLY